MEIFAEIDKSSGNEEHKARIRREHENTVSRCYQDLEWRGASCSAAEV